MRCDIQKFGCLFLISGDKRMKDPSQNDIKNIKIPFTKIINDE